MPLNVRKIVLKTKIIKCDLCIGSPIYLLACLISQFNYLFAFIFKCINLYLHLFFKFNFTCIYL